MRTIIFHYHFFKNAGTSFDAALKENFDDDQWVTKEFPAQPAANRGSVKQWILDNPQAKCFSSHTAILPPPQIAEISIIPVIFYRHPIDRIASAYTFEEKQLGDGFGPTLARNTTLAGYVETRLSIPSDRQCRNFHAHRLSFMFGELQGDESTRAFKAIDSLPFVGIVEEYEDSLKKLELLLKANNFETISLKPVEKNVSRMPGVKLDIKLDKIKRELGVNLFKKLCDSNELDLAIWNKLNSL